METNCLLDFRDFAKSTKNCTGPRNQYNFVKSVEIKTMYMTKYQVFCTVFEDWMNNITILTTGS